MHMRVILFAPDVPPVVSLGVNTGRRRVREHEYVAMRLWRMVKFDFECEFREIVIGNHCGQADDSGVRAEMDSFVCGGVEVANAGC